MVKVKLILDSHLCNKLRLSATRKVDTQYYSRSGPPGPPGYAGGKSSNNGLPGYERNGLHGSSRVDPLVVVSLVVIVTHQMRVKMVVPLIKMILLMMTTPLKVHNHLMEVIVKIPNRNRHGPQDP